MPGSIEDDSLTAELRRATAEIIFDSCAAMPLGDLQEEAVILRYVDKVAIQQFQSKDVVPHSAFLRDPHANSSFIAIADRALQASNDKRVQKASKHLGLIAV